MSRNLSQIVAELFARPMNATELSSQVQRLGDEIRKVIHSEDTMFGKYLGLLESFRTIIPDEKQRYQAALQALSTTTKLNRQEIIKTINGQLEELRIVEKGLMPTQQSWREVLKGLEARSQQLKGEIAQLYTRLAQLDSEDKAIQTSIAAQEQVLSFAEKTIKDLFANIGTEIASLSRKMEELTAEAPAVQPVTPVAQPMSPAVQPTPPAIWPTAPAAQQPPEQAPATSETTGEKTESEEKPAPVDTKFQRKCPMCGGQFNLLELENLWQCYTCGYEESAAGGAQGMKESTNTPAAPDPTNVQTSSFAVPLGDIVDEDSGSKKKSSTKSPTKKKDCPACGKKMSYHPNDKAWRCPACYYERRI